MVSIVEPFEFPSVFCGLSTILAGILIHISYPFFVFLENHAGVKSKRQSEKGSVFAPIYGAGNTKK